MARGSRRRGGWRRKGSKLQVYVRVHAKEGGLRTQSFPLGTEPAKLQVWIDDTVTDYRRRHPKGEPGTLRADVEKYLNYLVNRPALQRDRRFQLNWWCERFGHRARWALTSIELETAINELLASGKQPSTVRKYRTALYHLFTKLDGRNAPNPLRDVPPPRESEALPRALPFPIIDQILAHVAERRYARKLTSDQVTTIRFRLRTEKNLSAIARDFGVSETMIRKIRDRRAQRRHEHASQTKARLLMMAYLGWAPAMIRAFRPEDYDRATRTILARGRRKGGGSRAVRQTLIDDGVRAVEAFIEADAYERDLPTGQRTAFSMSSVLRAFRRAIKRLCDALEREPETKRLAGELRVQLASATPYSLRHSFLTEAQLATGNISATQGLAVHADARMTRRYTLAAVAPELAAAAVALNARFAAQRAGNTRTAGNVSGNEAGLSPSGIVENRPNLVGVVSGTIVAKQAAKVQNVSTK